MGTTSGGGPPAPLRLRVRVCPGARRRELRLREDGTWLVHLPAPARDGAANAELVRWLARDVLGVPRSRVRLVAGHRARDKVVEVVDPPPDALDRLRAEAR